MIIKIRTGVVLVVLLVTGVVSGFGQERRSNNDYQYVLIEAVKHKNLGNISEAIKRYNLVIKEKEDCDVAYYEVGNIYLMTNQFELARKNLEIAYNLDETNQWYTLAYLNSLGALEEYETLAEILKKKIEMLELENKVNVLSLEKKIIHYKKYA